MLLDTKMRHARRHGGDRPWLDALLSHLPQHCCWLLDADRSPAPGQRPNRALVRSLRPAPLEARRKLNVPAVPQASTRSTQVALQALAAAATSSRLAVTRVPRLPRVTQGLPQSWSAAAFQRAGADPHPAAA